MIGLSVSESLSRWSLTAIALIVGLLSSAIGSWFTSSRRLPSLYRIAVLGFPRCGKTTLITALFGYLFKNRIGGADIRPRGAETINRVNENIESLDLGLPVKPTTDQDVFAYRADLKLRSIPFPKRYKIEIGDFPGEDTVLFAERYGPWLHKTEYFKWAIDADAFIMVLDASELTGDSREAYIARQTSALRAAWQHLQDQTLDGPRGLAKRRVLLVCTKIDAYLNPERDLSSATDRKSPVPLLELQNYTNLLEAKYKLKDAFANLITFLERQNRRFDFVVESAYLIHIGERVGIADIAEFILPK